MRRGAEPRDRRDPAARCRGTPQLNAVRPTREADAACLPAIELSAGALFAALPDLAWVAENDATPVERHLALIAAGAHFVSVDAADAPIGFLAAERAGEDLHIWEVAVAGAHQGRGRGRALIVAAAQHARAAGARALTLTTFRDVAWNAPFYRRLDFCEIAEADLGARLTAILANEAALGLPPARRCAMRLPL